MHLEDTHCCAVQEIDGLSDHNTPKEAMRDVCEQLGLNGSGPRVPGFIIFTGVVGHKGSKEKPSYGPAFKAYIARHRLGVVTESVTRPNRINHPTHLIKVWVWAPNPVTLKAWAKKYVYTAADAD